MSAATTWPEFREPKPIEKAFHRAFGSLVGLGFGMGTNYLFEVRERKSGRDVSALEAATMTEVSKNSFIRSTREGASRARDRPDRGWRHSLIVNCISRSESRVVRAGGERAQPGMAASQGEERFLTALRSVRDDDLLRGRA